MISVENLEFHYPGSDFVLRIDGLRLESGSRVAVIGPSGSGKTTLLNLISGVSVPSGGRINLDGIEISALREPERRRYRVQNIGMVFQDFELLDYLTVLENILLPYRISGGLRLNKDVRERAQELAEGVGLGSKLRRNVELLSRGERQRVGICRALVTQPRLILADEPTGSLDPSNKGKVLDILVAYARRLNATFIAVTHDHDLLGHFERVVDFSC